MKKLALTFVLLSASATMVLPAEFPASVSEGASISTHDPLLPAASQTRRQRRRVRRMRRREYRMVRRDRRHERRERRRIHRYIRRTHRRG